MDKHCVTLKDFVEFFGILSGSFVSLSVCPVKDRSLDSVRATGPTPSEAVMFRLFSQYTGTMFIGNTDVPVIGTQKLHQSAGYFISGRLKKISVDPQKAQIMNTTIFPKTTVGDDLELFMRANGYTRALEFPSKYNTTVVLAPDDVLVSL